MTNTSNYTNLEYLRLMSDGDAEMEKTMLEMLLAELPQEFSKLKALHAAGEWEDLSSISHKMKSTLAFVGNEEMTAANKEIEQLAKHLTDLDRIASLIDILENNIWKAVSELEQELQA